MNSFKKHSNFRLFIKICIFSLAFERYYFGQFEDYTETYRKFNLEEVKKTWQVEGQK